MKVDELIDTMHATSEAAPLDLDRITRDGRRIRTRRRAALVGGMAIAVAAVAVPMALWQDQPRSEPARYAGTPQHSDETAAHEDVERDFLARAPIGAPLGAVVEPGRGEARKFYLVHRGGSSVGVLSVWGEPDGLAFGARAIDGDGSLRRAGALDLADLPRRGATLSRVPFQPANEATFVGLVPVPEGTKPGELGSGVESVETRVRTGVRLGVVPGRALVWVTATSEDDLDLTYFEVRLDGRLLASGHEFEAWHDSSWEPLSRP
jgi:hypothetical protein